MQKREEQIRITSFKYAFAVPTYTKFPTVDGHTFINWNGGYSYKH